MPTAKVTVEVETSGGDIMGRSQALASFIRAQGFPWVGRIYVDLTGQLEL